LIEQNLTLQSKKKETNSNNCNWKWCEGLGFVLIITGFVYFYLFVGYALKATDKWRKAVVLKAANAGKILQHGVGLYFLNFKIILQHKKVPDQLLVCGIGDL
jgi:hypothetical protein